MFQKVRISTTCVANEINGDVVPGKAQSMILHTWASTDVSQHQHMCSVACTNLVHGIDSNVFFAVGIVRQQKQDEIEGEEAQQAQDNQQPRRHLED